MNIACNFQEKKLEKKLIGGSIVQIGADWCKNCGDYGKSTKVCTKMEN